MTELDDKLRPGVKRLLERVGATVTLTTSAEPGDYDPTTGDVTFSSTNYTVLASPPSPFEEEAMRGESRGTNEDVIRQGDMTTILSAQLLDEANVPDPLPGWTLTIRSKVWQVLVVAPIMSGDQVCAWVLKLGR